MVQYPTKHVCLFNKLKWPISDDKMTLITKEWFRIVAYVLRSMYNGHKSFLVGFPSKILVF